MTKRLAAALREGRATRLAWEPQANEVFAVMRTGLAAELKSRGAVFYPWERPAGWAETLETDEALYRFVTSFATTADDVDRFASLVA
jgi:threonine aldolase